MILSPTACWVRYHGLTQGPCSWSLELEVVHCFFDFANITLPEDNIVVVPLSKLRRACKNCTEIADYFSVPGAREYLVAGQQITLCTGELGWALDHTSKSSLVAPITERTARITSKQFKNALKRVATKHQLDMCTNSESLPHLCSPVIQ